MEDLKPKIRSVFEKYLKLGHQDKGGALLVSEERLFQHVQIGDSTLAALICGQCSNAKRSQALK